MADINTRCGRGWRGLDPLTLTDPRTIGEFQILGRLGSGGMGQVYLGLSHSGRPIAVKVIRSEYAADAGFRERVAREVAAARTVGGFWAASVVAADAAAAQPWLATEYIAGPSLQHAVATTGVLPQARVASLAARLAEAPLWSKASQDRRLPNKSEASHCTSGRQTAILWPEERAVAARRV
jgi:serine/threonine protein kinase